MFLSSSSSLRDEVDQWFSEYFKTFIDIGAGKSDPSAILLFWGVPLHTSDSTHSKWLVTPEEVIGILDEMQGVLKKVGYTHTEAIDKSVIVYSENASRVETIMSRRRSDGTEVDRAAVSFELRRAGSNWTIISTAALPTTAKKLNEIW